MQFLCNILQTGSYKKYLIFAVVVAVLVFSPLVRGATNNETVESREDQTIVESSHSSEAGDGVEAGAGAEAAKTFLWIAVILVLAKLSSLVERIGQPSVLGELVMGVILGNLVLLGINIFEPIKHNEILGFLSELGVVILLFQIGLESNIKEMKKVGVPAFLVAIVGVVVPFVLGTYVVGPWLFPGLANNVYLFMGAALTATSVGITARVFQDLGKLGTREAKIILGAAVIDDVMGLIILAVVSAIVTVGAVSAGVVSLIIGKAVLFLVGSIVIGQLLAKHLGKLFSMIHTGVAMKLTLALSFGLGFAYLAQFIGLAPIVGAFAAGLVLDPVHFVGFKSHDMIHEVEECLGNCTDDKTKKRLGQIIGYHAHKHIEDIIAPIGHFVIPIFFILTGMQTNLSVLFNGKILLVALGFTVAAVVGKYVSGFVAGKGANKHIVGFGMVPRGEVGLIFASIGAALGVINDELFSVIVIMVIFTTLMTPPILAVLLRKQQQSA